MLRRAVCLTAVALGGLVPLGVQAAQTGGDVTVGEQAGSAQVVLRAAPGAAVRWTTVDGTATAGTDYSPATATTTFGAGQTEVVLNIPVVQDGLVEGDEVFGVAIVEVSGDGAQAPTIANVTIRDDDFLPGVCANARTGTSGVDVVAGGPAGDRITVLEGDDTVRALAGDDCVLAGPGNDRVFGSSGADTLDGDVGDDLLDGGAGNDVLRGGAGGNIGSQAAAKATPDGYTLLVTISASQAINPALYPRTGFDPVKDFAPVSMLATVPNVVVVHPSFEAKTMADLIAMAKEKPDGIFYASAGNGTLNHLVGEMVTSSAGIRLKHVPYRGIAPALTDVIAGHIPLAFGNLPAVLSQVQAGTVRALAVSSKDRSPFLPNVPSIAETLPGFNADLWVALYAVAGTPQPIVDKLLTAKHKALASPEAKEKFAQQGATITPSTPAQLAARLDDDLKLWSQIVKASGAKID